MYVSFFFFLALTVDWHTARDFHLCMEPSFVHWCGPLNPIIPLIFKPRPLKDCEHLFKLKKKKKKILRVHWKHLKPRLEKRVQMGSIRIFFFTFFLLADLHAGILAAQRWL